MTGLTVDGVNILNSKLTKEEKCDILHKIVDLLDEDEIENEITDLIQLKGDWEHIGDCEQCGDSIYEYTLEI